jgi:hypothetical protein
MQTVFYKREKLIKQAIGCALLAAAGFWCASQPTFHWQIRLMGGLLAFSLPSVSILLLSRWHKNVPAIHFDDDRLHLSSLYRSASFSWSEIRHVDREKLTQAAAFGLIKQTIASYLVVTVADGSNFEKKFKIQEDLLEWPRDGLDALADEIYQKRVVTAPQRSNTETPNKPIGIGHRPVGSTPGRPAFGRKAT